MKEMMDWGRCRKEFIREISADNDKISSILHMCSVRLRFISKQDVDDETASIIVENYYEIIKELLTALLLNNGFKSSNHECLLSFFSFKYPSYEYEASVMHLLKNIRNRIAYDGLFVEKSYLDKNKLEFEHIISLLSGLIKR